MEHVIAYAERNRRAFLERLLGFLRIPSISTDPAHQPDVALAAEFVAEELRRIGLEHVAIMPTARHPVVYADWLHAPGKPTVLFYGHYDVQPADPVESWTTGPFDPTVRNGELFARGATDDKGQVFITLKALEAHLRAAGRLPVNVKLIIEGEEEIGSPSLDAFIAAHADRLAADLALVHDTTMFRKGLPSICYGIRGLVYFQVDVRGTRGDLHSGSFGGAVVNPINALAGMIAALKDAGGRITIPGFYDDVRPLSGAEREAIAALPFDEEAFRDRLGAPALFGEQGYTTLERVWARPTLDVNGLRGGWTGPGAKTVIAATAMAKLSLRLVPDQEPHKIAERFEAHLRRICPPSVHLTLTRIPGGAKPWLAPIDHPFIQAAARALERGFGAKPVFIREGGSIPVVATLTEVLKLPCVLVGFGLPDCAAHAPDEKLDLDCFYGGIRGVAYYYQELAAA
jgi:acetylornithine deacetylase/succinyl-diaminopimelate desuccinylase-like protein